jgi:hypothetical protein
MSFKSVWLTDPRLPFPLPVTDIFDIKFLPWWFLPVLKIASMATPGPLWFFRGALRRSVFSWISFCSFIAFRWHSSRRTLLSNVNFKFQWATISTEVGIKSVESTDISPAVQGLHCVYSSE